MFKFGENANCLKFNIKNYFTRGKWQRRRMIKNNMAIKNSLVSTLNLLKYNNTIILAKLILTKKKI